MPGWRSLEMWYFQSVSSRAMGSQMCMSLFGYLGLILVVISPVLGFGRVDV